MDNNIYIFKPGRSISIDPMTIENYCVYYARDVHQDPRKPAYDIKKGRDSNLNVPKINFGFDAKNKIIVFHDIPDESEHNQNMVLHIRNTDPFRLAGFYSSDKKEKLMTVAATDISEYHIIWMYLSYVLNFRHHIEKEQTQNFNTEIKIVELPLAGEGCKAYYIKDDEELKKYGITSQDVNNKYGTNITYGAPCIIIDNKCYNRGDKISSIIKAYREYYTSYNGSYNLTVAVDNEDYNRDFIYEMIISMMFYGFSEEEILSSFEAIVDEEDLTAYKTKIPEYINKCKMEVFEEYKNIYYSRYKNVDKQIGEIRSMNKHAQAQYVQTTVAPMIWWNDSVEHNHIFRGRGNPVMEGLKDENDNFESVPINEDNKKVDVKYSYPADLTLEDLLSRDWDSEEQYYLSMDELIGKNRKAR